MTPIQQLRETLEDALGGIGPALQCWGDFMPVSYDEVRLTRLHLEQSHHLLRDALALVNALEQEQKKKALMVFTTDKGERFSIPGIIVAQPSPASESGNKQAPVPVRIGWCLKCL